MYVGFEVFIVDDWRVWIDVIVLYDVDVQMSFYLIVFNVGCCIVDGSLSFGEIEVIQFVFYWFMFEGDFWCIELVVGYMEIVVCEFVKFGR